MTELYNFRKEYKKGKLQEQDVEKDPMLQFGIWMDDAIAFPLLEPNAMTLVTATRIGKPSARVVLLKSYDEKGFVFYTNYDSRKGKEIRENPYGCIVFDWHIMERQVRIEGIIEKVSDEESDEYFNSRPDDSKLGAWVSNQSEVIGNREELKRKQKYVEKQFRNSTIIRPPHWGGFVLMPAIIEFWQGRQSRLHDRLVYVKTSNEWKMSRLAP